MTEVALESGGSSSFEWPRWCSGWEKVEELTDMIAKHDMYSVFPCGCAFGLTIKGLKPLKPWRAVTTNERVAVEMNDKRCRHPKRFRHDHLEGGKLAAYLSGFCNRAMATSILCSVFPERFLEGVPAMPTAVDSSEECTPEKWTKIADQLNNGVCLQHAQALVHKVISRKEIKEETRKREKEKLLGKKHRKLGR